MPTVPVSRRWILRCSMLLGLFVRPAHALRYALPVGLGSDEAACLQALVDTLIPRDRTPGAVDLGVHERLLERARQDPAYRKRLRAGCAWIESGARKERATRFATLPLAQREALVEQAAVADPATPEHDFFQLLRRDVFFHYYGQPATWAGLGYPGPPQPHGFRDYAAPPRSDRR